jgi:hypothetical protein
MATHPVMIDISNNPDLVRLVEEVKNTKKPRILKQDSEPVAMLMPMEPAGKQRDKKARSQTHYKAFLAAAGSLKGFIDAERLKKDIYESRKLLTRPAIEV